MSKIAILSNVNLDILIQTQKKKHTVFETEGYGEWFRYAFAPDEKLRSFGAEYLFLLLDGFALLENVSSDEDAFQELDMALNQVEQLASNYPHCEIFVSTMHMRARMLFPGNAGRKELKWCGYWNDKLPDLCNKGQNIRIFDLALVTESMGADKFYSDKLWYMGSVPYSMKGMGEISNAIDAMLESCSRPAKKVLILDLDNTLWGGVLGEDGIEGVILGSSLLGAAYRDAQKRIKELKNMGVLLAIVSKNNEEDVLDMLDSSTQMVLRRDDFAVIYANWDPKPVNIRRIAEHLNLGLDSMVFLDDNPVEREAVIQELPMVCVVDFPRDVANLPETIREIYAEYFFRSRLTAEDMEKTEQYRAEANRRQDMQQAGTMEDFLKALQISIVIQEATEAQTDRIVQLTNKTNQFNTCTVRFDRQEYFAFLEESGNHVYAVNVADRYGDSGLVMIVTVSTTGQEAEIRNILMSCRVMGRQIEYAVMEAIENRLYEAGVRSVRASYIPTMKNRPVETLWDSMGYTLVEETGAGKRYRKELSCLQENALLQAQWR